MDGAGGDIAGEYEACGGRIADNPGVTNEQAESAFHARRKVLRTIAILCFAGAMLFAFVRGPVRSMAPGGSSDFSLIWLSTRAWLVGESPYSVEATDRVWVKHSGETKPPENERIAAILVYPPSTFAVLAPWCWMEWHPSKVLWAATGYVLLVGSVVLLLGLVGLSPGGSAWWFAGAAMLAMFPGHTGISVGQPVALVLFLIVWAQAMRVLGRWNASGVALGLASAIKPQIGLLFLAYEVGRGRWRTVIAGVLTLAGLAAVGVLVLRLYGIDWLPAWRENMRAFVLTDNADPSLANPLRYHLVNLHVWLHAFMADVRVVNWMVWGAVGLLCAVFLAFDRFRAESRSEMLSLSMVACASLMLVYHRGYDAVVLLIPAAMFAAKWARGRFGWRDAVAAACLAIYLAPGATTLVELAKRGVIPGWVAEGWWWNGLLIPHAAIAVLVLSVLLVFERRDEARVGSPARA